MEVILIQDVNTLGGKNEVVKVKNGYARNFLIPQKFAVEASPSNLKQLNERLKVQKKKEDAMMAEIKSVIAKLTEAPVKMTAKTGTSGKIFGSITTVMVSRAINEQKGYQIDRRKIHLPEDMKEIGTHKVKVDFGNGNEAEFEIEVVAEA
ncbi:50S ribosomal protein L9 [Lacibacter sp. MH-610]|mgnify:FL=1|jgi:large subunit ribosomal protein L9|uniref:50S ribosomal protein L9 n=1 Tax=Lacibacter sp. MH-610 TaxID=3020883 RepID=UPI0038917F62